MYDKDGAFQYGAILRKKVKELQEEELEPAGEVPPAKTKKRIPFKELEKSQKILRIVAICVTGLVTLCGIVSAIYYPVFAPNYPTPNRFGVSLGMVALGCAPYLLELVLRNRLSSFLLVFVYTFVFFSGVLGCCVDLYNKLSWYDVLIHGIFGYVGAASALYLLVKTKNYKGLNMFGAVFLVFAVSLMLGALWEIFEFAMDTLFGNDGQGWPITVISGFIDKGTSQIPIESGTVIRAVTDTMEDVIMNTVGAFVFAMHLLIHRLSKKNLLIGSAIDNFAR